MVYLSWIFPDRDAWNQVNHGDRSLPYQATGQDDRAGKPLGCPRDPKPHPVHYPWRWGRVTLLGWTVLGLSLTPLNPALAQTLPPLEQSPGTGDSLTQDPRDSESGIPLDVERSVVFWRSAQGLTQRQDDLLDRVETAFTSSDPNRSRVARGQVILYLAEVERFLNDPGPTAPALGDRTACTRNLDRVRVMADYRWVCAVRQDLPHWEALLPLLDARLIALGTIASVEPLPLVSGEMVINPAGIPQEQRGQLRDPAPSITDFRPDRAIVPLPLGRPYKSALGDYQAPLDPAIAPLEVGLGQVDRLKSSLRALWEIVPRQFQPPPSDPVPPSSEANPITPAEALTHPMATYETWLTLPDTGLAVIRTPETTTSRGPRNRLETIVDPFPPLPLSQGNTPDSGFVPRLPLQISPETPAQLTLATPDLDYGVVVAIGDVPLDHLDPQLRQAPLREEHRRFLLTYQPPREVLPLQRDRRRILTGKQAAFHLRQPLQTRAPFTPDTTYLVRSIQFQLPQSPITPTPRTLNPPAQIPAADLLLAVRPLFQRQDGSYLVIWRLLQPFPSPHLTTLD